MAEETEAARKLRLSRERRMAIEKSIKDGTFGNTAPAAAAKPAAAPAARATPQQLGTGAAARAGSAISGRQRQVDNAVEEAERGPSLSTAKRPRAY